jgi:hypothetical protein
MKQPPDAARNEQRLLRNARREGLVIMAVWAAALLWNISVGYLLGYHRNPEDIRLVLGMPDWVFWSTVLPWGICLVFSVWFCFVYMADDDLGRDRYEDPGHA